MRVGVLPLLVGRVPFIPKWYPIPSKDGCPRPGVTVSSNIGFYPSSFTFLSWCSTRSEILPLLVSDSWMGHNNQVNLESY